MPIGKRRSIFQRMAGYERLTQKVTLQNEYFKEKLSEQDPLIKLKPASFAETTKKVPLKPLTQQALRLKVVNHLVAAEISKDNTLKKRFSKKKTRGKTATKQTTM